MTHYTSDDAARVLADGGDTMARIERVTDLVTGFETPFGLEVLATVHWVAWHNAIKDVSQVVKWVYAWNERKRQFTERQIKLACQVLADKNWLEPATVASKSAIPV